MKKLLHLLTIAILSPAAQASSAMVPACQAQSGPQLATVVELYTSEGCSSCPPADRWLSSLKQAVASGQVVAQAFHVGYWDYIGWADRFASPLHTTRQRQIAATNRVSGIYTPQVVRNGIDWRQWPAAALPFPTTGAPRASLTIRQTGLDRFEARVLPTDAGAAPWAAYWTVTEHGHSSRVSAGENRGEFLKHDFVVRQYQPMGEYRGAASLSLRTVAADPGHPRQINLVVYEPGSGKPLQALSLSCQQSG